LETPAEADLLRENKTTLNQDAPVRTKGNCECLKKLDYDLNFRERLLDGIEKGIQLTVFLQRLLCFGYYIEVRNLHKDKIGRWIV
jgi:hypothetical protein